MLGFILMCLEEKPNAFALEVRVKETVSVRNETVFLGDVASFTPINDERVIELSSIKVASSPPPGKALVLNSRYLVYKLASAVSKKDNIKIKLPENLVVKREAQIFNVEKQKNIFKEYVLANAPWPNDSIRFERINVPGPLMLPHGKLEWEIKNRGNFNFIGDLALVVKFSVEGRVFRTVSISGRISIEKRVVKTARSIRRGDLIDRNDLVVVSERSIRARKGIFTEPDVAIGKIATRHIPTGALLEENMLKSSPIVKKGKRVIIKAENNEIRITTFGKALEDGTRGEQVKVINISSGKEIFATVSGPGRVKVSF
jgi:flagella basal body P-ring formation protein FlgA